MKKLLFFASDFKIGLSALLCDQLISIANAGIDYVAVAGENEQENGLGEMLQQKGIIPIRIDGLDKHKNFSRLVNRIKEIVLKENIDIIHVQNNWQLAIAAVVKMRILFRHKLEIAYTLHGFRNNSLVKSYIAQVVIGGALFFVADHIICMTEYLKRKFRVLSYKIRLIPLGVKDDYFIPQFVAPEINSLQLVFPAQFREGKNQDLVIKAFARYVRSGSDENARLTLPGTGPLIERMQKLAEKLGVKCQVIFPGQLSKEEVKQAYLASNVAIVASNSETFGQSIVEPFVLGRCVVSTPVGIAPEIINEGENGYIFSTENELMEIFQNLTAKKLTVSRIGENNYESRDRFRWENITNRYIKAIL